MSGIPSWAFVGAKVICVEPFAYVNAVQRKHAPVLPEKGVVYTIEAASVCRLCGIADLSLVEVQTIPFGGEVVAWDVSHFRPLVTRTQEQDMAIFAPLLGHTVREDA